MTLLPSSPSLPYRPPLSLCSTHSIFHHPTLPWHCSLTTNALCFSSTFAVVSFLQTLPCDFHSLRPNRRSDFYYESDVNHHYHRNPLKSRRTPTTSGCKTTPESVDHPLCPGMRSLFLLSNIAVLNSRMWVSAHAAMIVKLGWRRKKVIPPHDPLFTYASVGYRGVALLR